MPGSELVRVRVELPTAPKQPGTRNQEPENLPENSPEADPPLRRSTQSRNPSGALWTVTLVRNLREGRCSNLKSLLLCYVCVCIVI